MRSISPSLPRGNNHQIYGGTHPNVFPFLYFLYLSDVEYGTFWFDELGGIEVITNTKRDERYFMDS